MDILRKMFGTNEDPEKSNIKDKNVIKDHFRKPQWFEESETDDELFDDDRKFAFQIFTNPMELQKYFERQMQQMLDAVAEMDGDVNSEKNVKEDFLKPGFENIFKELENQKKILQDTDLDGEIYADELHSLIQRLSPGEENTSNILPRNDNKPNLSVRQSKKKFTDEEIIFGKIHGTFAEEEARPKVQRPRPDIMTPMTPMLPRSATPFGGVFDGTYTGPKMFSQSVFTKTIRKPDGSYETTKITQDSQGNKTTTITRSVNGKTETITTRDGNECIASKKNANANVKEQSYSDPNIFITKKGYAVPRNIW